MKRVPLALLIILFAVPVFAASEWFIVAKEYEIGKDTIPAYFKVQIDGKVTKLQPTETETGVYPKYDVTKFVGTGQRKIRMRACNKADKCSLWSDWYKFKLLPDDTPDNLLLIREPSSEKVRSEK